MLPIIRDIQARGIVSLKDIAAELTRQKWPTARGQSEWSLVGVKRILERTADERIASVLLHSGVHTLQDRFPLSEERHLFENLSGVG
jgi:hypothetical protein